MKWNASWCPAVLLHAGGKTITAIKLNNEWFQDIYWKDTRPLQPFDGPILCSHWVHWCYRRVDMYWFWFSLKDTLCILLAKCIECEFWDAFMLLLRCFGFYRWCFVAFRWLSITKVNLDKKIWVGGTSSFNVATLPKHLYFQMNPTGPRFWKGFAWRVLYRNGLSNTLNYVNNAEMQVSATELV